MDCHFSVSYRSLIDGFEFSEWVFSDLSLELLWKALDWVSDEQNLKVSGFLHASYASGRRQWIMYALQTDLFISRFNSYAHNRTWLLLLLRRYIWTIYTWDPERFKAQEGGYRDHEHRRAPLLFSKHILRLWRNNRIPIQISPEFFIWIWSS